MRRTTWALAIVAVAMPPCIREPDPKEKLNYHAGVGDAGSSLTVESFLLLRPQGVAYTADSTREDIEQILYIRELPSSGPSTPGTLKVRGVLRSDITSTVDIQLDPDPTPDESMHPLYKVTRLGDGKDLCGNQNYDALPEEKVTACGGDGGQSCPKLDKLNKRAMLAPGYWSDGGWHRYNNNLEPVSTVSCLSGIVAKCLHWGYDNDKDDERKTFRACVMAARAQYKDGESYTCPQTRFDIYDKSIQPKESASAFESLWDENGLVCLHHTRFDCPKLNGYKLCSTVPRTPKGALLESSAGGLIAVASDQKAAPLTCGCP